MMHAFSERCVAWPEAVLLLRLNKVGSPGAQQPDASAGRLVDHGERPLTVILGARHATTAARAPTVSHLALRVGRLGSSGSKNREEPVPCYASNRSRNSSSSCAL